MPTLTDKLIRHQVYLEGLKYGELSTFNPVLAAIDKDIKQALSGINSDGLGALSKVALLKLMRSLRVTLLKRYNKYTDDMLKFLKAFMAVEIGMSRAIFADEFVDDPVRAAKLDAEDDDDTLIALWWPRAAKSILPANGLVLSDFVTGLGIAGALAVTQTLQRAAANRDSRDATLAAVEALRKRLEAQTRAVLATALQSVSAQSQAAFAKIVGIDQYEWVSILDSRTSDICRSRSGQRYLYGKGPLPPAHPNCRSLIVPVVDGVAIPNPSFKDWTNGLPTKVRADMFRGPISERFEGTKAITLKVFKGKIELILAE